MKIRYPQICSLAPLLLWSLLPSAASRDAEGNQEKSRAPKPQREVAVTIDDLPATHGDLRKMREITIKLLASLKSSGVRAGGFVNEAKLFVRGLGVQPAPPEPEFVARLFAAYRR